MHKLQLVYLVTMVGLSTFLQSAVGADRHFDNLNDYISNAKYGGQFKNMVKLFDERCKNAATGVENSTIYQVYKRGASEILICFLDADLLMVEKIEKASTLDYLNTASNKYCTDVIKCTLDFNEKVQPCHSASEREQYAVAMRITTRLWGDMCSMSDFDIKRVVEEGPKCLATSKDALNACFHNSFPDIKMLKLLDFGDLVSESNLNTEWDQQQMQTLLDFGNLVTEPRLCTEWEHFQSCTLQQLKNCREKAPASVAEAVFKIFKNEGPCKQNGAGTAPINAVSLMLTSGVMLLVNRMLNM